VPHKNPPMSIENQLMAAVERMPAFPKSVQRVLELTRNPDVAPKDIVDVIEKDPVLAARILRVINSAFYALPNKVASVSQAVVLLGINTVKNLAIRSAAVGMIPTTNTAGFDTDAYLLHSLGAAEVGKSLAQKFADVDPSEAYIAGLLHDFGKILFTLYMPEPFQQALTMVYDRNIPLYQAEREVLGVDHTVAGALLAQRWEFPESLIEAIKHHHATPPATGLGRTLWLANELVKVRALGHAGSMAVAPLPTGIGAPLGESYEAIAASLPDLERQFELVRGYVSTWKQG
jgi:putative nucleotidyltransferase with HDIG domain